MYMYIAYGSNSLLKTKHKLNIYYLFTRRSDGPLDQASNFYDDRRGQTWPR